jgi:hypothetical protein
MARWCIRGQSGLHQRGERQPQQRGPQARLGVLLLLLPEPIAVAVPLRCGLSVFGLPWRRSCAAAATTDPTEIAETTSATAAAWASRVAQAAQACPDRGGRRCTGLMYINYNPYL